MLERVGDVDSCISMTFVHGSHSWIDNRIGYEVKYIRENSFVDVQVFYLLRVLQGCGLGLDAVLRRTNVLSRSRLGKK